MILLVAGSRTIKDRELVFGKLDEITQTNTPDVVISGGAVGVDTLGESWANSRDYPFVPFVAVWKEMGKRAGYLRNIQMAVAATHAVIFWDGQSRGARHMIDLCRDYDVEVRIVRTDNENGE